MPLAMHSHSTVPFMLLLCTDTWHVKALQSWFLVPRHIFFFQTREATISLFIIFVTFIIRINVEVQYVTEHLLPSNVSQCPATVDFYGNCGLDSRTEHCTAYYDSYYEIINWVPHVLYSINLLSLPCDILPEFFFFFFAENFDFVCFFFEKSQ